MAPLLKNLLGHNSKDQDHAAELRVVLHDLQEERRHCEALIHSVHASADRRQYLNEPIAKAGSDVDAVAARLTELEQRMAAMATLVRQFDALEERANGLVDDQKQAETHVAAVVEDATKIRALFEGTEQKIDQALQLKERLEAFLEIDKPFQALRAEADAVRGQVDATNEQFSRLRDQHDRLFDAHKMALTKMEALDRRRDDLGRALQDKERRVTDVEAAVRGMDGMQNTVGELRREIGTLKALGDTVVQKSAALEAQRDAVDRALAQSENLDRAMRQVDAGIRQQQANEKSLNAMSD